MEKARQVLLKNPNSGPAKVALGLNYLKLKEYGKAEPLWRSFEPPANLVASRLKYLAYSLEGQNRLAEAGVAYAEASGYEKDLWEKSMLELCAACCFLETGQSVKAEKYFRRSIASDEDNFSALLGLASMMADQKNWAEFRSLYRRAKPLAATSNQKWLIERFVKLFPDKL